MSENDLLTRITFHPKIFGGKPVIRGRRLAVEHVLGMLAAGDTTETLLNAYPWLEADDVRACLLYARKVVAQERIEPLILSPALKSCWIRASPACWFALLWSKPAMTSSGPVNGRAIPAMRRFSPMPTWKGVPS